MSKNKKKNYYYDIVEDLNAYPEAWAYIVVGGRNTGKTYSALKHCYTNKIPFVFVKRTNDDVKVLCSGSKKRSEHIEFDMSPFKPINRDVGCNVEPVQIAKGIGGFFNCDEEGIPAGKPVGYIISLNVINDVKGFDLSECDFLIFDEFIPKKWERVNRKEGDQLMELYKTVSRDRIHRGKAPLKMLCLANATDISSPTTNVLEITDTMAEMSVRDEHIFCDDIRGIFINILKTNEEFMETEKKDPLYKAMGETQWGQMAFNNEFAYNDFTNVGKIRLKNYMPIVAIIYNRKTFYVYMKNGLYYMTLSKNNKCKVYNLNMENHQKKFYYDYALDLRNECIEGRMMFETYTMYDLIINYKKYFVI